jgi:hypothetical protein
MPLSKNFIFTKIFLFTEPPTPYDFSILTLNQFTYSKEDVGHMWQMHQEPTSGSGRKLFKSFFFSSRNLWKNEET